MEQNDNYLIELIKNGNESAFDKVYLKYFKNLHTYAQNFTKDNDTAEEIIQNVFCRIWEKRHQLKTDGYLKSFLYRAVHNECINFLKHETVRSSFNVYHTNQMKHTESDLSTEILASELEKQMHSAINELPDQCRLIFQMSRFEQLKYQQIAEQLHISIKTVENQMGKALKILRIKLADFLPVLILYLTSLIKCL